MGCSLNGVGRPSSLPSQLPVGNSRNGLGNSGAHRRKDGWRGGWINLQGWRRKIGEHIHAHFRFDCGRQIFEVIMDMFADLYLGYCASCELHDVRMELSFFPWSSGSPGYPTLEFELQKISLLGDSFPTWKVLVFLYFCQSYHSCSCSVSLL